jgi:hypothetical protein
MALNIKGRVKIKIKIPLKASSSSKINIGALTEEYTNALNKVLHKQENSIEDNQLSVIPELVLDNSKPAVVEKAVKYNIVSNINREGTLSRLTTEDVKELNLLRPAVFSNGYLYIGSVHSTYSDIYYSEQNIDIKRLVNGFVDKDNNFLTREQAAEWLRRSSYISWKELKSKSTLEITDYRQAVGIETMDGKCYVEIQKRQDLATQLRLPQWDVK